MMQWVMRLAPVVVLGGLGLILGPILQKIFNVPPQAMAWVAGLLTVGGAGAALLMARRRRGS